MACRIVICDDQPGYRRVLVAVLGLEAGLEVVGEAADGRRVVEVVEALQPDVLLLDIAMPEQDGLEALSELRSIAPDTAIVMLTGFGSERIRQRAIEGGATAFVEKGTDITDLVSTIREVCAA